MGNENDRSDAVDAVADQAAGAAKEDLGKVTGNKELEAEGRIQKAEGEMEAGVSNAENAVDEAAEDANKTLDGE